MSIKPAQLTLPIGIDETLNFDNFIEGANTRLLAHIRHQLVLRLQTVDASYSGIVLWGGNNAGKTHLLHALVQWFKQSGGKVYWLTQSRLELDQPKANSDSLYVLDDIEAIAVNDEAERTLLTVIERIKQEQAMLLLTARQSANSLSIGLADLSSRIKAMDSFELLQLEDTQKREVVRQRAYQRGIILTDEVLDWLFNHTSRDLGALLALLEQMDVISLTQKRKVTIPLIKTILFEQ